MTGRSGPLAAVCATTWIDEVYPVYVSGIMSRTHLPPSPYATAWFALRSCQHPASATTTTIIYYIFFVIIVCRFAPVCRHRGIHIQVLYIHIHSRGGSTRRPRPQSTCPTYCSIPIIIIIYLLLLYTSPSPGLSTVICLHQTPSPPSTYNPVTVIYHRTRLRKTSLVIG